MTTPTFGNSAYYLTTETTWTDAQDQARAMGGNLVTINSRAESDFLVNTFGGREYLWIGYNDAKIEGRWEWVSGETSTYTNWHEGEPNNLGGDQHYALTNFDEVAGEWDDEYNSKKFRGIVEVTTQIPGLVYRFYNPVSKGHFFTTSEGERDTLLNNPQWGYAYENYGFQASEVAGIGTTPIYRFYNPKSQGHFFTANEAEKNTVLANPGWGYIFEDVGFYAYSSQIGESLPVYRFYNPVSQGHFFTINEAEKNTVLANPGWGYQFEGVGFYANAV
jgi:hypothetical protein